MRPGEVFFCAAEKVKLWYALNEPRRNSLNEECMKKLSGIIIAFSFAFMLSGCSANEKAITKETVDNLQSNAGGVAERGSKEECVKGCVMLWKANKDNVTKPESEMTNYCNQLCEAGQGMKNLDPERCAQGEGAYRDTCYLNVARDTIDSGLCEKIENEAFRSGCYRDIVAKNKDKSLCEKVTIKYIKDSCLKK